MGGIFYFVCPGVVATRLIFSSPDRRTAALDHWILRDSGWVSAGVALPKAGSHGFTHHEGDRVCYGGFLWGDAHSVKGKHDTAKDCIHAPNTTAWGTVFCRQGTGQWKQVSSMPKSTSHFSSLTVVCSYALIQLMVF